MFQRRALHKITRLGAGDLVPFAGKLLRGAKRKVDELAERALGPEFNERVELLREEYERSGDPFGLDVAYTHYAALLPALLHRKYFRTRVFGIENVPPRRALLIANHSGQVPIDGMMIGMSMYLDATPPRLVRAMVEKWVQTLPFFSPVFARSGQVVGVPENCRRLLEREELILVFPEGVRGISKPFSRRYQLEQFGLGFMRLAIETQTPIIPVAVIGAEEQYLNLGNLDRVAKSLGLPVLPVIPQVLGGMIPLPTRYSIYFGEPLEFTGDPDDDDSAIEEKVWLVRQTIQSMLNRGLRERTGVFA